MSEPHEVYESEPSRVRVRENTGGVQWAELQRGGAAPRLDWNVVGNIKWVWIGVGIVSMWALPAKRAACTARAPGLLSRTQSLELRDDDTLERAVEQGQYDHMDSVRAAAGHVAERVSALDTLSSAASDDGTY